MTWYEPSIQGNHALSDGEADSLCLPWEMVPHHGRSWTVSKRSIPFALFINRQSSPPRFLLAWFVKYLPPTIENVLQCSCAQTICTFKLMLRRYMPLDCCFSHHSRVDLPADLVNFCTVYPNHLHTLFL